MTRRLPWIGLFPLVACGSLSGPDANPTTTGAGGPTDEEVRIERIEPNFGTNAGGDFVTLEGGPFPVDPVVTIGGVEAEVLQSTTNQIQVTTPPSEKTEWAKLSIDGPDGVVASRKKAFQYWPDGSGLTGLWGEVYRLDFLGTYWTPSSGTAAGPYTPPPVGQVRMLWLQPADFEYQDVWAPYWDWCEVDYDPRLNANTQYTGMDSFTLSGSDGEFVRLVPGQNNYFEDLEVPPIDLAPGTVFSLDPGASTGDWPAFGIEGIAEVPQRPNITLPPLDDVAPPLSGPDIELQWDVSPSSSYMVAILSRTSSSGAVIEERATCLLNDDGQHTIPAATWSDWTEGEFVLVQIGRVSAANKLLPHNRSRSQLVGVYFVYGALQTTY